MPYTSNKSPTWTAWLPVICLAFAAFIFNTTEFVPVGLLPSIASSFSMDVAHTGLLITGYAWVVTIMSLPLTVMTAKCERRLLLIILFVLFIASHLLAGVAWSFELLMLARIGIACAHAIFWSITIPLAVRIAPYGKKAKALSLMVTGSSLATVLGVPIGTIIGQYAGWRITFLCIAAIAFVVAITIMLLLPKLPSSNTGSFKSLPSLLKRPALIHAYVLIALLVTGHFTAYTYITPFMNEVGHFSEQFIVFLLLCIGIAGIIGSILFTRITDKYPMFSLFAPVISLLLCLVTLTFATISMSTTIILCVLWGVSMTMIGLCMQSKVLAVAPDASDVAVSMYSGIFNIGIGAGALVGNQTLVHLQVADIGYTGALFVIIALMLCILSSWKYWKTTS